MRRKIQALINENNQAGLQANIHLQSDGKFVDEVSGIIGELRTIVGDSKIIKDSEELMINNKQGLEIVSRLEQSITNRFIINSKANFRILADISGNAFAYVTTPNKVKSILVGNNTSIEEGLAEAIKTISTLDLNSGERNMSEEMGVNNITEVKNLLNTIVENSKMLEDHLKSNVVELDLVNSTMSNLPDDMSFIIGIDIYAFLGKLPDREIVSSLLHEIGHIYTTMVDLYRSADTNVVLRDLITSSDNNAQEKILLTLSKEFNLTVPMTASKNKNKETLILLTDAIEAVVKNKEKNTKTNTSSEKLADQFVTSFGLEIEYYRALKIIGVTPYSEVEYKLNFPEIALVQMALNFLMVFSLLLLLSSNLLVVIAWIMLGSAKSGLLMIRLSLRFFSGTDDANETIYDDNKRRLEVVRNSLVRRINSLVPRDNIDRQLIKDKLANLNEMDRDLDLIKKNRSAVGILGELIIPSLRKKSKDTIVNELLEDMDANRLLVLSERIKMSGGL